MNNPPIIYPDDQAKESVMPDLEATTPPFAAFIEGRTISPVRIVRETRTQWVDDRGDRWRKKDRRLIGDTDQWFKKSLLIPGDEQYQAAVYEVRRGAIENRARAALQKALDSNCTLEARMNAAKSAFSCLNQLSDLRDRNAAA